MAERNARGQFVKAPERDAFGRFKSQPKLEPTGKFTPAKAQRPPPKRLPDGRFAPKAPVSWRTRQPIPPELAKRARAAQDAVLERQRIVDNWEKWKRKVWERQPTAAIDVTEAIKAGIDPADPTALGGWKLLHLYSEDPEELDAYLETARADDIKEKWAATGALPIKASRAPGRYDVRRKWATPNGILAAVFSIEWLQVAALRWEPMDQETAKGVNSYVKQGDAMVERRRKKTFKAQSAKGKKYG